MMKLASPKRMKKIVRCDTLEAKNDDDDSISVHIHSRRPRAIMILLFGGWNDSSSSDNNKDKSKKLINTYIESYMHKLECSIVATSHTGNDNIDSNSIAITILRETARLVRMAELSEMGYGQIPVLVHVVGRSGCLLLKEIERCLLEVSNDNNSNSNNNNDNKYNIINNNSNPIQTDSTNDDNSSTSHHPFTSSWPAFLNQSMRSLPSLADTEEDETTTTSGSLHRTTSDISSQEDLQDDDTCCSNNDNSFRTSRTNDTIKSQSQNEEQYRLTDDNVSCYSSENQNNPTLTYNHITYHKVRRLVYMEHQATSCCDDNQDNKVHSSYTYTHNTEYRALKNDICTASKLTCIIFDSIDSDNQNHVEHNQNQNQNPLLRLASQFISSMHHQIQQHHHHHDNLIGSITSVNTEFCDKKEATNSLQFWEDLEQLSLSGRHVYIIREEKDKNNNRKLVEVMDIQKSRGLNVKQYKLSSITNNNNYTNTQQYNNMIETILDSVGAKRITCFHDRILDDLKEQEKDDENDVISSGYNCS